ncbi:MAG: rod shape-determining protein MreC, partial [Clostridia bacterium]|nr:rod shape-determining protein MreC [Clostridia bacterium]
VFGYVKETSVTSCKVVSIVETASAVGAFIERSGATGLVEGDYTLRADGLVLMKRIPISADVKVGDPVHTSGTGSVYPRGLLIGTVKEITSDPYSRTLTAVIAPREDFTALDDISHLMIVTGFEVYARPSDSTEIETTASTEEETP